MSAAGEKVGRLATPLRKERIHNCGQLPVDSKLFNVRDANNNAVGCELEEHEADAVVSRCNGYDALLTQRDALQDELRVVAEAIWQNVSRKEMTHWAQGILVSIKGEEPPKFTIADPQRDALEAREKVLREALIEARDAIVEGSLLCMERSVGKVPVTSKDYYLRVAKKLDTLAALATGIAK